MRRLPPGLRRFLRALRRVLLAEPEPRNLREKIMKRLQIKATRYYKLRSEAEKSSFEGLWVEGARDEKPGASPAARSRASARTSCNAGDGNPLR